MVAIDSCASILFSHGICVGHEQLSTIYSNSGSLMIPVEKKFFSALSAVLEKAFANSAVTSSCVIAFPMLDINYLSITCKYAFFKGPKNSTLWLQSLRLLYGSEFKKRVPFSRQKSTAGKLLKWLSNISRTGSSLLDLTEVWKYTNHLGNNLEFIKPLSDNINVVQGGV